MRLMGNPVGRMAPKANWAQTNANMADYIRNKPDLSGFALQEDLESVSGQVLTNREDLTIAENDITVLQENVNAVNAEIATIKGNIPDTTLSISGKAADAKATGDALAKLKPDNTLLMSGVPADAQATGEAIGEVRTDLDKIADHIVETGTEESTDYTGTWYWEKWENGKAVCYGTFDFGSISVNNALGNLYRCDAMTKDFPSSLFVGAPYWNANYLVGDGSAWIMPNYTINNPTTAANTSGFYLMKTEKATITGAVLGFLAVGRWKVDEETVKEVAE